jgi:hypothetical protein
MVEEELCANLLGSLFVMAGEVLDESAHISGVGGVELGRGEVRWQVAEGIHLFILGGWL